MDKVVTIIVTYNAMNWIERCLTALLESSYPSVVVVVDNQSQDDTVPFIRRTFPQVELIVADRNLGFGQGNNIGIRYALGKQADYFFLLNQDAYIESQTIPALINRFKTAKGYGILSPVHRNGSSTGFDDHFYGYLLNSEYQEEDLALLEKGIPVDKLIGSPFVNAACWMVSARCIEEVGGFDPIFFHYGEDDNYGQRVLYKNLRIGIYLGSFVIHDKSRDPVDAKLPLGKRINREWVQFLVYACDVKRGNYVLFMAKRFVSHSGKFALCTGKLDLYGARMNLALAFRICTSFLSVASSRKVARASVKYAHLGISDNLRPGTH